MNPDAWDDSLYPFEYKYMVDVRNSTGLSLREEQELFTDYYRNEDIIADSGYTEKMYSQRDFDYRLERELIIATREYKEREDSLIAELNKLKTTVAQMTAKFEKVEKMETLLDRYALHSEIDYDKNTYEFVDYDSRS